VLKIRRSGSKSLQVIKGELPAEDMEVSFFQKGKDSFKSCKSSQAGAGATKQSLYNTSPKTGFLV
jgi:hypothetical protein